MLDVIENIADAINWHFLKVVHPLINDFEDSLVLVGFADVFNDILTVGTVNSEHLSCIILVFQLLENLCVHSAPKLYFPA